jgi:hypothetical protein
MEDGQNRTSNLSNTIPEPPDDLIIIVLSKYMAATLNAFDFMAMTSEQMPNLTWRDVWPTA